MRAKARIMIEIKEVQEKMKVDMEAMKEHMTTMMSMRKMMEHNTATVVATSTAIEMDPIHLVQSKHSFPPYGLPPNYTPPIVVYAYGENISNSTPVFIDNQQSQSNHAHVSQHMGETHEVLQDHTLAGFGIYPGYTIEEQAFSGITVLNAPEISQCCPLSQPLHFARGEGPFINAQSSQRPPLNRPQNPPAIHPRPNTTPNTNQNTNQGRNFPEKKPVEFTPILISYVDFLPYLLDNAMVVASPSKILKPPFPRGYNSNVTCAYHGGVLGHSIEHCMTLKHKVQSLIDAGWLRFEEENHL
ncbi:hypothetical protein HKD37_04G011073 [Glycine soja]